MREKPKPPSPEEALFLGVVIGMVMGAVGLVILAASADYFVGTSPAKGQEMRRRCIEHGGTYSEDSTGRYSGCAGLKHIEPERAP